MLKKLSLLLCFLLFSMTTTQAATVNGLKQLVDEFNFSIQVEWDQKDKDFYNKELKKFEVGLQKLQDEGLTSKEIMSFIESEVKDKNVVKAIKDSMTMIDVNKLDRETSKKILMNNMELAYKRGASWHSDPGVVVAGIFAFLAILVVFVLVLGATGSGGGGSSSGSSSGGSYDDGDDDSGFFDWDSGSDSGSSDSGSSDSGSSDSGSSDYDYGGGYDSGDSGSGGDSSGHGDSDGDGWGDGWDWIIRPTFA